MELQTNPPAARFNRAVAYLKADQLDNARADFIALQNVYTNTFQVAYGFGRWIADRQKQTNEAILAISEIYMANAPTNTLEFTNATSRLTQLRGH